MPTLLDGTTATIDLTIATASYKCHMSSMAIEFSRTTNSQITFCSTNWELAINAMKSIRGVASGFLASGDAPSKFGANFLADTYPAIVATFTTGCTVGFTAVITRDAGSIAAASNSGRTIEFRNHNDDVVVAWVIT